MGDKELIFTLSLNRSVYYNVLIIINEIIDFKMRDSVFKPECILVLNY